MSDLIAALLIFKKYADHRWPTNCSHDELAIMGIGKGVVSEDDAKELDRLGFVFDDSEEYWKSFRFGSA